MFAASKIRSTVALSIILYAKVIQNAHTPKSNNLFLLSEGENERLDKSGVPFSTLCKEKFHTFPWCFDDFLLILHHLSVWAERLRQTTDSAEWSPSPRQPSILLWE
jgi:hypothetical protein